jgi:hypothetical protein
MKFLIINTDYPTSLRSLYANYTGLEKRSYDDQMRVRMGSLFGVADFYSSNLRKLGYEAWDVHVNNGFMQKVWARENGIKLSFSWPRRFGIRRHRFPEIGPARNPKWMFEILAAQIKYFKPDVILNQSIGLSSKFFREVKPYARLLIGQHAAPLPEWLDLSVYDLIISSLPNLVDYFRRHGLPAEMHRLGFESSVLECLGEGEKTKSVTFVGSLFSVHASRRRWLDHVCRHVGVEVWGGGANGFPEDSAVFSYRKGTAWGLEMYRILQSSRITLNHHIDVAECYANNLRLYEATGVGTLLITDWKENLREMFEPDKEVVAYRSPQECVELIQYYLEHDDERVAIASAGQRRTLGEHSYYQRMKELVEIVHKYV